MTSKPKTGRCSCWEGYLKKLQSPGCPGHSIRDGVLCFLGPKGDGRVVPKSLRKTLVQGYHSSAMSGHFSAPKLVARHWWWQGMHGEITEHCSSSVLPLDAHISLYSHGIPDYGIGHYGATKDEDWQPLCSGVSRLLDEVALLCLTRKLSDLSGVPESLTEVPICSHTS